MNLEAAYQLGCVGSDGTSAVARRAKLYAKAPVRDMVRRGWIEPSDTIEVLERRVLDFLGISSIEDEPVLPFATLRASLRPTPPALRPSAHS